MKDNYLVFAVKNESKVQIAECDNLGDCERVIAEYCDERDMLRLSRRELYDLHHMEYKFQTQNREINFLVVKKGYAKELKERIEEFLNDYFEMEEFDCDDTINYLQDAVDLLQDVLKEMRTNYSSCNDNELETNIPTANEFLSYRLEDDATEFGGISFEGETLNDFLSEVGMSPDTPMNEINESLIECGIKPIEY